MPLPKDECAGAIQHTAGAFPPAACGFLAGMLDG
jgi:hypothetical protein